jgi:hypothetical protein
MDGYLLKKTVKCSEIITAVYNLRKQGGTQELFVDLVLKEFAE